MLHRKTTFVSPARRGFSFVELLFAIGVLGIGFIMLAAIFPVGLQQAKLTIDETTAAANARGMAARMEYLAATVNQYNTGVGQTLPLMPVTFLHAATGASQGARYNGTVRTFNDPRPIAHLPLGFGNNPAIGPGVDNIYNTPDDFVITVPDQQLFRLNSWRAVAHEIIQPGDNRLATTFLFKRDAVAVEDPTNAGNFIYGPAPTAQIFAINAQVTNQSAYANGDVAYTPGPANAITPRNPIYNLEPRPVAVQIVKDQEGNYVASFRSVTTLTGGGIYNRGGYPTGTHSAGLNWDAVLNAAVNAVTEGAFIIISDDRVTAPAASVGRTNGRIFKIGQRREDLDANGFTFNLVPGYEFSPDGGGDGSFFTGATSPQPGSFRDDLFAIGVDKGSTIWSGLPNPMTVAASSAVTLAGDGAVAFVLGRGFTDSSGVTPIAATGYTGLAQDVSVYTTFVPASY